jgi:hypothetical protein
VECLPPVPRATGSASAGQIGGGLAVEDAGEALTRWRSPEAAAVLFCSEDRRRGFGRARRERKNELITLIC